MFSHTHHHTAHSMNLPSTVFALDLDWDKMIISPFNTEVKQKWLVRTSSNSRTSLCAHVHFILATMYTLTASLAHCSGEMREKQIL